MKSLWDIGLNNKLILLIDIDLFQSGRFENILDVVVMLVSIVILIELLLIVFQVLLFDLFAFIYHGVQVGLVGKVVRVIVVPLFI